MYVNTLDKIGANNVFHAVQCGSYDNHVHQKMSHV